MVLFLSPSDIRSLMSSYEPTGRKVSPSTTIGQLIKLLGLLKYALYVSRPIGLYVDKVQEQG